MIAARRPSCTASRELLLAESPDQAAAEDCFHQAVALPFLGAAWLEMDPESVHHALDLGDGMADRFFGAIQV